MAKLHHTLCSIRVSLRYLGTVFLFGYGLFVWYSLLIQVLSFYCMFVSFGYGVFRYGLLIWVWCFHLGVVSSSGYSVFILMWSPHLGMVFSFGCGLFI